MWTVKSVGVYELEEVERGATVTITRHGKPIAELAPVGSGTRQRDEAIDAILAFGRRHRGALKGLSYRDLIEDGRRY
jgi:antitoxin (DNA-binding transcriptional repressor) of toxin-antitoxin stability system